MRLTTIVNFCTNEARFLPACLQEAARFSAQIIVPVCDHFFDGRKENGPLLEAIYRAFPNVEFIEYPFFEVPKRVFKNLTPAHFWHSLSRLVAFPFVQESSEGVLFLDADEVADGGRVKAWVEGGGVRHHVVMRLANYWYFREPRFRADPWEDSLVFAKRKALSPEVLLQNDERGAIYDLLPGPKRRHVTGLDAKPLFHHYSWVRTKEEMLTKVRAWGHRGDRDWERLVEEEFQGPFKGVDFVHGYKFQTIDPPHPISLNEVLFQPQGTPRLYKVNERDLLKQIRSVFPFWERLWIRS